MYSEYDRKIKSNYQIDDDDAYEEESNNNNKSSIVIKIIVIIACVILLFWLISLLKKDDEQEPVVYNPTVHNENITTTRLAAERYFFLNNNLPQGNVTKTVTLKTLVNQKLGKNLVDANYKVCDSSKSTVSLNKETSSYVMRINLSCSTNEKEEIFYYDANTHICLNCEGKTYMDKKEEPKEEKEETEEKGTNLDYSCTEWSDWSSERVTKDGLLEKSRILVRGIKKGRKIDNIVYGEWSEWQTSSITSSETLEVETKTESRSSWSSEKTTTEHITNSSTVKIISETKEEDQIEKYCPSGSTMRGNKCYQTRRGELNYIEYNSENITNRTCSSVRNQKNSSGRYEIIYENCTYTIATEPLTRRIEGQTIYTYKTLSRYNVTYYRSRSVTKELIQEDDIITDEYYEEDKLPSGYEKYVGSEKFEYSYKLKSCLK